ncbi:DUF1223 domain-containing protein [Pseudoteredinibacter isoporae]|uniref:DUF1223 domain-containing protein n=1 Tax=Pseudoteredinibacter isoporae TaxID=570281 RepID=A0A7X0JSH7_9GAMM|nr:DUF1223 domain-containing protein [Pseudoteredinibacter isoporae]MBB6520868.1 hypothetical protein [Pseudoteredinibacter isoporae]NHO86433.1 DUF1223 domain-containing protein [Pseudoteredinibacter isoporae]NIB25115.1 DUF1223 domain-containing protein [Pseudoteredinibacter isoporae]
MSPYRLNMAFNSALILLSFALITIAPNAQAKTLESQATNPMLLELYTSQGCSSCPPAERWFTKLKQSPDLWRKLIPINFHVDYWDYLGWEDPFAQRQFSHRQRIYKHLGHSRTVATPGFMTNGEQWNGWFYRRPIPQSNNKAIGKLSADLSEHDARIAFQPEQRAEKKSYTVNLAILGFGLKHKIKAGENRRKTLQHDFVVLDYAKAELNSKGKAKLDLPDVEAFNAKEQAIVIWLSEGRDPSPLLAMGDWL